MDSCQHGDVLSGIKKDGEIINQLNYYKFLKKVYTPWSYLVFMW
jgi:hypothetical protein